MDDERQSARSFHRFASLDTPAAEVRADALLRQLAGTLEHKDLAESAPLDRSGIASRAGPGARP